MSELKNKAEQVKGHAKEAVGDLTDDDQLRAEGKADRASGKIKEKAGPPRTRSRTIVDATR